MSRRSIAASKKLLSVGGYVTLRACAVGSGRYDPATQTTADPTPSDTVRIGWLVDQLNNRATMKFGHLERDNTMIEGQLKWMLMDALGRDPKIQDKIFVGTIEYVILNVQTVADHDGPVIHTLALGL